MAKSWSGVILADNSSTSHLVTLSAQHNPTTWLGERSALRFLAIVDVHLIPLHLFTGVQYSVATEDAETAQWFRSCLLTPQYEGSATSPPWWESGRPDSPTGILVGVETSQEVEPNQGASVTELLFYASRTVPVTAPPPSPPSSPCALVTGAVRTAEGTFGVYALALSSDLDVTTAGPTPPSSPRSEAPEIEAVFLPQRKLGLAEVIHEPPVRKRRNVSDAFDEAAERRKKARRKGGEGVAAAAAVQAESDMPSLKHRRTISGTTSQSVPLQTRPLSRSPSVASSRPITARAPSEAPKRSALSRVQSISVAGENNSIEDQNKELVSRIVMAGMRLYGLSRSKDRKPRTTMSEPGYAAVASGQLKEETAPEEEYKLVYHQVFKGTCFAFRRRLAVNLLQLHAEAVQDIVDRLLGLYCNDPLTDGLPSVADEFTPGGGRVLQRSQTSLVHSATSQER
ncbi:hypothetical protein BAUCODRAFT_24225 [Baudoinia panamericana UAMH 10762]|uniref:Sld7 C-terminal domain-containing protein n=1 Tax=Baudoinia panamericana (strain UAMH 10762) TaxID=717646 RepID=M2MY06_BAUPA|nr:uncharacterized protein BAUCODRAFT_24225 [Baudoinia panamericana UAMH 10762]EMC96453.1 hypothetical protein BAUCODRAFT_24225 [Baudoinia panamericana UAMH 10762]